MPLQPTGTVTLLFTDIEGSTRKWEQHPQAMHAVIASHDALVSKKIAANGGYVFKTVGDAFCAAFSTAAQALDASIAIQRALAAIQWGAVGRLKVRIALHTGTVEARGNDYFGLPLNRVARLLGAAHGGQILLSLATQQLVRDQLPFCITLKDLGEGALRDLVYTEHIYQVVAPDLPAEFPPLRVLDTDRTEALTLPATSPVGLSGTTIRAERTVLGRPGNGMLTEDSPFRVFAIVGVPRPGKSRLLQTGRAVSLRHGGRPGADHWLLVEMLSGAYQVIGAEALVAGGPVQSVNGRRNREPIWYEAPEQGKAAGRLETVNRALVALLLTILLTGLSDNGSQPVSPNVGSVVNYAAATVDHQISTAPRTTLQSYGLEDVRLLAVPSLGPYWNTPSPDGKYFPELVEGGVIVPSGAGPSEAALRYGCSDYATQGEQRLIVGK